MSRSARPPRPFGCDRRDLALLLALAAAAGALLFHGLDRVYLWQDEAATALMGERLLAHGKPLAWDGSPVLNAFIPGLGNSRAKHAGATFDITNSVVQSRDLEIRAGLMRMQFKGSVDFEQRVEGRMEAEMLRGLPAVGFVLSKVFWPVTKLFEYKVTGTLGDPKTEQLFVISRVLLFPFQPIKTIRELFEPDKKTDEKPPAAAPAPEP